VSREDSIVLCISAGFAVVKALLVFVVEIYSLFEEKMGLPGAGSFESLVVCSAGEQTADSLIFVSFSFFTKKVGKTNTWISIALQYVIAFSSLTRLFALLGTAPFCELGTLYCICPH
jgi:hypothetical protein